MQGEPRAAKNSSAYLETSTEGSSSSRVSTVPSVLTPPFPGKSFQLALPHPCPFSVPTSVKHFSKWGEEHRLASEHPERSGVSARI